MASNHLGPARTPSVPGPSFQPTKVINTYRTGVQNFQLQRLTEYNKIKKTNLVRGYHPNHSDRPKTRRSEHPSDDESKSEMDRTNNDIGESEDSDDEMI